MVVRTSWLRMFMRWVAPGVPYGREYMTGGGGERGCQFVVEWQS